MANNRRNRPEADDTDITHSRLPVLRADKRFQDRPVDAADVPELHEPVDVREARFTSIRFKAGKAVKRVIGRKEKKP